MQIKTQKHKMENGKQKTNKITKIKKKEIHSVSWTPQQWIEGKTQEQILCSQQQSEFLQTETEEMVQWWIGVELLCKTKC